jgi:hypothetical protein
MMSSLVLFVMASVPIHVPVHLTPQLCRMLWANHSAGLPFVAFESEQDPIGFNPIIDGITVKPAARLALLYLH